MTSLFKLPTSRKWVGLLSFQAYKKKYGSLLIPSDFVIPTDASWPKATHNFPLGSIASKYLDRSLRAKSQEFVENKKELVDLGVISSQTQLEREKILLGVRTFIELNNSSEIPSTFIIPANDMNWPEVLWNFSLGVKFEKIQRNSTHPSIHKELRNLGCDIRQAPTHVSSEHFEKLYNTLLGSEEGAGGAMEESELGECLTFLEAYGVEKKNHKKLLALGINLTLPSTTYKIVDILHAFTTYKFIHQTFTMNRFFVIPHGNSQYPERTWGMPLGKIKADIKSNRSYSFYRAQFEEIGLFDTRKKLKKIIKLDKDTGKVSFSHFLEAVKAFQALNNNQNIPNSFIVPMHDSNYPPITWGMKLGRIQKLFAKTHATELAQHNIKLTYSSRYISQNARFVRVFQSLQSYKLVHGDLNVPSNFIVPHNDTNFPTKAWGMKLGHVLNSIRRNNLYVDYKQQFMDIGIVFDSEEKIYRGYNFYCIYSAFKTYKTINQHLYVPYSFVVPESTNYPANTWGIRLGSVLHNIRESNQYAEHREKLIELGISFEPIINKVPFDVIFDALEVYKTRYGNVDVPVSYVVPHSRKYAFVRKSDSGSNSSNSSIGSNSDINISSSSSYGSNNSSDAENRSEGGVNSDTIHNYSSSIVNDHQSNSSDGDKNSKISTPISTSIGSSIGSSIRYKSKSNTPMYDIEAWGINLGIIVQCIRRGLTFKEHREKLTQLGINYNIKPKVKHSFEIVYTALLAYKAVHNNVSVVWDFIVPQRDSNYPENTWGLKLGTCLNNVKYKGTFAQHKQAFVDIGVVFLNDSDGSADSAAAVESANNESILRTE